LIITKHGLKQKHLKERNKFILLANKLNIRSKGLVLPKAKLYSDYWYYDKDGEKLGTIFIHITVENFTKGYSIFENHAGCERGYFITEAGEQYHLLSMLIKRNIRQVIKTK